MIGSNHAWPPQPLVLGVEPRTLLVNVYQLHTHQSHRLQSHVSLRHVLQRHSTLSSLQRLLCAIVSALEYPEGLARRAVDLEEGLGMEEVDLLAVQLKQLLQKVAGQEAAEILAQAAMLL
jgi:hypothetical protein